MTRDDTVHVPWSREASERFVRDAWSGFAQWMNTTRLARPEGNRLDNATISDDWLEFRSRLNELTGYPEDWIQGAPPERGLPKLMSGVAVPAGHLMIRSGVLTLNLGGKAPAIFNVPKSSRRSRREKPIQALHRPRATLNAKALDVRRNLWMRLLMVLSAEPDLRNRIRACAQCGRYEMLKTARADRGKGYRAYFCSDECRSAHKREGDRKRLKAAYERGRKHVREMRGLAQRHELRDRKRG
jgi:hypothetical protein